MNNPINTPIQKMYDKEFRNRLIDNPKTVIQELGYQKINDDVEAVIVKDSKNLFHIVMHKPDEVNALDFKAINAAGVGSSISTAGTAGTATLTVSTAGSLGTIGTAF